MILKNWLLGCTLLIGFMAGCTSPPSKLYVQNSDDVETRTDHTEKLAVLCDVCCTRDSERIVVDDSQRAEGFMLNEIRETVTKKGYKTVAELSPFVGGYKNPEGTFTVSMSKDQETRNVHPPFFWDAALESDEEYRDAMKYLQHFVQICFDRGFNRSARFSVNPIARRCVTLVKERTGAEAILIANGNGNYVPTGKSVAQGIATGVLTGLLTFGTVVAVSYDVSHLDSYVALIDANDVELLWSNSLRLTDKHPQNEDCYKKRWGHNLLYYLPSCQK